MKPQNIAETDWYYEYPSYMLLVHEVRSRGRRSHPNRQYQNPMAEDRRIPKAVLQAEKTLMKHHVLKSWPEYFEPLMTGARTFDLRRNDRDYQVGDLVTFKEWEPKTNSYSGREITKQISYLMHGVGVGAIEPLKGIAIGYCILQVMEAI